MERKRGTFNVEEGLKVGEDVESVTVIKLWICVFVINRNRIG